MILAAYAELYDLRGGTVEIELEEDKQGLGVERRDKKRFAAQQMVMLLGTLAPNVMVWAERWLVADTQRLNKYGVLRLLQALRSPRCQPHVTALLDILPRPILRQTS